MRIDKPTLQCDRCKTETQDLTEMMRWMSLRYNYPGGTDEWDLCNECSRAYMAWLSGGGDRTGDQSGRSRSTPETLEVGAQEQHTEEDA